MQSTNPRYTIHAPLGQGGMGIVHRAMDRLTGKTVALKQIHASTKSLQFTSRPASSTEYSLRVALTQEFQILAGLRHPHIISVLDYGFDSEKQPYYAMSYLPNAQTILEAGGNLPIDEKIDLLRQMLQALSYLHRRGILHRDLKPSNILVAEEKVQVLDFGLAIPLNAHHNDTTTGGSLFYMAPELLRRESASVASDLYAMGIIAFELFAGTHPYSIYRDTFAHAVQHIEPEWTLLTLERELVTIIQKLLAKRPEDRFKSADDCLDMFGHVVGESQEDVAIRESYLQAATFVGRDEELAQLTTALNTAQAGRGSTWFVGGESGVGKSRLLRELQMQALIDGFIVLRGQAADGEGFPYQLWRAPLRTLLLMVEEVDEMTGSVLKAIVPDIEQLLQQEIPSAPSLGKEAAQLRLFTQIKRLFEQCEHPICLLLEDIHWSNEGLGPLPLLFQLALKKRLLIIASYRDDEKPALAQQSSNIQHLKLNRLTESAIAQLCESMLGEAGKNSALQELLLRETEGNAYFTVEMVRAWAEDAGRLQDIDIHALPEKVFPDGIQSIVQRRIKRVPPLAQPLLQLAALVGREIDHHLLSGMADGIDVENWWLQTCADVAILEVQNNTWQFSHDKIREGILAQLSQKERIEGHRRVASTMESLYSEDETYLASLTLHWGEAEERQKEKTYAILAGDYLKAQYLEDEARTYYERAYSLMTPACTAEEQIQHVNLLNNLSRIMGAISLNQRQAYNLAIEAQALAQSGPLAQKPYYEGIQKGKLSQCAALSHEGCNREKLSILHDLVKNSTIDTVPQLHTEASYYAGSTHWFLGEYVEAEQFAQYTLTCAEKIGDLSAIFDACLLMGMVCEKLQRPDEEVAYEQRALTIARKLGVERHEAAILNNHSYTLFKQGRVKAAIAYALEALRIAREINNVRKEAEIRENLIEYFRYQKEHDKALEQYEKNMKLMEGKKLGSIQANCNVEIALMSLEQGTPRKALAYLNKATQLSDAIDLRDDLIILNKAFVRAYSALGNEEKVGFYEKKLRLLG